MYGEEVLGENKKIIGARKIVYDDILFDSKLEISCYKILKENNINFNYNKNKLQLIRGFRLNKTRYFTTDIKTKYIREYHTKNGEKLKISPITYTPDFEIIVNDEIVIYIETKGYANDVYPYKRKLFFDSIEKQSHFSEVYFFELKTVKQIKEGINIIKTIIHEKNR